MSTRYVVRQGDTLAKIAFEHGFFAEDLWDRPENRELKEKRGDMNVLFPGDVVVIPEKEAKSIPVPTGQVHRFRRKGVPALLRLQVLDDDVPLANQPYTLVVDGLERKGVTDDQGVLRQYVSPQAREGRLQVGEDHEWTLSFGHMDPVETLSGVQKRLQNLGYDPGPTDGQPSLRTREALEAFQRNFQLTPTGEMDEPTRAKLDEVYRISK